MGPGHHHRLVRRASNINVTTGIDRYRAVSLLFRSLLFVTLFVYLYRLYYTFIRPPPFELLYDCIPPLSSSWMRSLCFDHTWLPLNTLLLGLLTVMWVGMLAVLVVYAR